MERKIIMGKEYIIEKVTVHEKEMSIVGVVSTANPNYVEFISTRPQELQPSNGVLTNTMTIDEFISDMRFLHSCLNENEISQATLGNILFKICDKHILKAQRLIDVDLYTYIDEVILVIYSAIMKFFNREMNKDEISSVWIDLKKKSFSKYKDDIYITKYDTTDPFSPKSELFKYNSYKD